MSALIEESAQSDQGQGLSWVGCSGGACDFKFGGAELEAHSPRWGDAFRFRSYDEKRGESCGDSDKVGLFDCLLSCWWESHPCSERTMVRTFYVLPIFPQQRKQQSRTTKISPPLAYLITPELAGVL